MPRPPRQGWWFPRQGWHSGVQEMTRRAVGRAANGTGELSTVMAERSAGPTRGSVPAVGTPSHSAEKQKDGTFSTYACPSVHRGKSCHVGVSISAPRAPSPKNSSSSQPGVLAVAIAPSPRREARKQTLPAYVCTIHHDVKARTKRRKGKRLESSMRTMCLIPPY